MKLVLAEKPSVAQSIAKVLGATKREDGYLEGNGYVVSWCVGHLVELSQPEAYDEKYNKWAYADLPIFPDQWKYQVSASTKKQFGILKKLMARKDVESLVCATDAGREGELIFRLVYQQAGCRKPFERLWISSMIMNEMTYTQVGDYRIPDIELKNTETKPLGKYGRMRRAFLQENNPMLLNDLILSEQLFPHLQEICLRKLRILKPPTSFTSQCRMRNLKRLLCSLLIISKTW